MLYDLQYIGPAFFYEGVGVIGAAYDLEAPFHEEPLRLAAEPGGVFVMLVGYKEKANNIPPGKIRSAEQRIEIWRKRRGK